MQETTPGTMLAERALLRVAGPDVRGFLQGLVTSDAIAGPFPQWSALLTPQGQVLFDFILWTDGEDVLVDVERPQREALARRLAMYRLRRPITIAPEDALAVHWSASSAMTQGVADPRLSGLGRRWLAPPGAAAVGWRAHRLSLGVAEGVEELGAGDILWLECNARELNGVSFAKGCYVGQENTARMHHRDKVARRIVVAPIAEDPRRRIAWPELGLMVTQRRVDSLGDALIPAWLAPILAAS